MSKDITVYELRPEKGKERSRILHRNLLLPCGHLPLEPPVQPRAKKRNVKEVQGAEKSEEEEEDDEYYPVQTQQSRLCSPETEIPVCTTIPQEPECIQSDENVPPEQDRQIRRTCQSLKITTLRTHLWRLMSPHLHRVFPVTRSCSGLGDNTDSPRFSHMIDSVHQPVTT